MTSWVDAKDFEENCRACHRHGPRTERKLLWATGWLDSHSGRLRACGAKHSLGWHGARNKRPHAGAAIKHGVGAIPGGWHGQTSRLASLRHDLLSSRGVMPSPEGVDEYLRLISYGEAFVKAPTPDARGGGGHRVGKGGGGLALVRDARSDSYARVHGVATVSAGPGFVVRAVLSKIERGR